MPIWGPDRTPIDIFDGPGRRLALSCRALLLGRRDTIPLSNQPDDPIQGLGDGDLTYQPHGIFGASMPGPIPGSDEIRTA
jgi:hypothetical protein